MTDAEQPRRAAAYIRESTEEQGRGYSPDGQRQAIARYAADHNLELVKEYIDFETGRLADKRPDFQRLIEHAMEHRFEVVLIFHTSRFARNTIEAKHYKKLLRTQLGIEVISVTQPLGADTNDPAAFLSESVHEIFDEYYSVSLSFWTKMGLREKARQGLLTGSLPWGLTKDEDAIPVPDVEKAPFVLRIFELYAAGQHTDRTLAEWLNVQGQRTTPPTPATSPEGATAPRQSRASTKRSSPRSCSTACSLCAASAPALSSQGAPPPSMCCVGSRAAGAATPGCKAPAAGAT
jgi:site-specific DNA recombinase